MCLEVKSKIYKTEIAPSFSVKEEITIDDNFITYEPEIVARDEIKTESFDDNALDGVKEAAAPQNEIEEHSIIVTACKKISPLSEKGIIQHELNCALKLQPVNKKKVLKIKRRKRRYKKSKMYTHLDVQDKTIKLCLICGKTFLSQKCFEAHKNFHRENNNKLPIINVSKESSTLSVNQMLNSNNNIIRKQIDGKSKNSSPCIELVTIMFQDLAIKRKTSCQLRNTRLKLLPKLNYENNKMQGKKIKPILLRPTKQQSKREFLRNPTLTLKGNNSPVEIDLNSGMHEAFGTLSTPLPPLSFDSSIYLSKKSFIAEEVLQKSMTHYVISILKEITTNNLTNVDIGNTVENVRQEFESNKDHYDHSYSMMCESDFPEEIDWRTKQVHKKGYNIKVLESGLIPETEDNTSSEKQTIKSKTGEVFLQGSLEKKSRLSMNNLEDLDKSGEKMDVAIIECTELTQNSNTIFMHFDIMSYKTALKQRKSDSLDLICNEVKIGTLLKTLPSECQEIFEKSMTNNVVYISVPFKPKNKITVDVPLNIFKKIRSKVYISCMSDMVDMFFYIPLQRQRNKNVIIEVKPYLTTLVNKHISVTIKDYHLNELQYRVPINKLSEKVLKTNEADNQGTISIIGKAHYKNCKLISGDTTFLEEQNIKTAGTCDIAYSSSDSNCGDNDLDETNKIYSDDEGESLERIKENDLKRKVNICSADLLPKKRKVIEDSEKIGMSLNIIESNHELESNFKETKSAGTRRSVRLSKNINQKFSYIEEKLKTAKKVSSLEIAKPKTEKSNETSPSKLISTFENACEVTMDISNITESSTESRSFNDVDEIDFIEDIKLQLSDNEEIKLEQLKLPEAQQQPQRRIKRKRTHLTQRKHYRFLRRRQALKIQKQKETKRQQETALLKKKKMMSLRWVNYPFRRSEYTTRAKIRTLEMENTMGDVTTQTDNDLLKVVETNQSPLNNKEDQLLRCKHCSLYFKMDENKLLHVRNCHLDTSRVVDTTATKSKFYCNVISKIRKHSTSLIKTTCSICNKSFSEDYYNNAHKYICGKTIEKFTAQYISSVCNVPFKEVHEKQIEDTIKTDERFELYENT